MPFRLKKRAFNQWLPVLTYKAENLSHTGTQSNGTQLNGTQREMKRSMLDLILEYETCRKTSIDDIIERVVTVVRLKCRWTCRKTK